MKQYLSCADTAKLVRAALKEAFPGVKFSVKSSVYAGGASINVSYTDGPSSSQVKGIVGVFEGSYFCGMTDYKGTNYSALDGQPVSFGADYIFVNRSLSYRALTAIAKNVCDKYDLGDAIKINDSQFGAYISTINISDDAQKRGFDNRYIGNMMNDACFAYSEDDAAESKTFNRVTFLGDDGYGYNSVGKVAA